MVTQIATDLEIIVLNWLDKHNIEYQFQTSLAGGYFELGGAVVDILLPDRRIAIRIFGEYWHEGIVPQGKDLMQREMLMSMGYTVVDLWGQDLENRLDETMRLALQGVEMLH